MRLIPGDECARVYSFLGGRPFNARIGCGGGCGFGSHLFDPRQISGCALFCCTDVSSYPGAVGFPADPCTNGTFTGESGWTKGAQWTLPGTTADKAAGGANNLTQACLTVGNTYTITYTINSVAAGTITLYAGTTAGTARNAAGTYTETLACAGNTSLGFVPSAADTTCQIDNVLVSPRNASSLVDLTGLGHNLVQATPAKQPLWVASGAGGVLRGDGTADLMTASFSLPQPATRFVVAKWPTVAGVHVLIEGIGDNTGALYSLNNSTSVLVYNVNEFSGPAMADGTWRICESTVNGAASILATNGGAVTAGTCGAGNLNGCSIFARSSGLYTTNADIAAVIAFSRTISEPERQRIVRWCNRLRSRLAI